MLGSLILSAGFGIDITPDDQASLADKGLGLAEAASAFVGFLLVLYGRITASKDITL